MKYSKNIVSTYTRRVKVKSSHRLVETFSTSVETATRLYNFTLSYMQKLYGKNHIDRYIPRGQAQNYLTNAIKTQFLEKFYNGGKWSQKETNLNSQSANYIIEETILHFRKYRNKLFGYSQMTEQQKQELKTNKKKNPMQKSWYKMYGLNFKREGQNKSSIPFKSNGQAGPQIIHHKRVFLPQFGYIELEKSIGKYKKCKVLTARLKRRENGDFELHLTFKRELPRGVPTVSRGADWGMLNNVIYTFDNGDELKINKEIIAKSKSLSSEIRKIQSQLETERVKGKRKALEQKKRKFHARHTNLIDEYYRKIAVKVYNTTDLLVIEDLDSKQMRKERYEVMSRGFNRKLNLIKPGKLAEIMLGRANKLGKTLIKVDSYKTSQVEHGTTHIEKHDLSERKWISKITGETIERDVNAAKNILSWGLNPEGHIKLSLFSDIKPENLIIVN